MFIIQEIHRYFWVDDQNELIVSNVTGQSNTQIDNQFLWLINYDGVNQTKCKSKIVII